MTGGLYMRWRFLPHAVGFRTHVHFMCVLCIYILCYFSYPVAQELIRDKAAETYRNGGTDTPSPQSPSSKRKEESVSPLELAGDIARAEIDRARLRKEQLVKKRNDNRREREGDGGEECISEERLLEEVEEALDNHAADGTGLRDFANKAIGGKVVSGVYMYGCMYHVCIFQQQTYE